MLPLVILGSRLWGPSLRQPLVVSDLPVYRPTLLPICACLLCLHVHPSPNLLPSHLLCLPPCPSFPARIPALSSPPLLTMEAYTGLAVTLPRHPQGLLQLVLSALLPAFPRRPSLAGPRVIRPEMGQAAPTTRLPGLPEGFLPSSQPGDLPGLLPCSTCLDYPFGLATPNCRP